MKKTLLLMIGLCIGIISQAIIVISTPGELSSAITAAGETNETVIELTINGHIDSRDFVTMRVNMPLLKIIDLSEVKIVSYTGRGGTQGDISVTYEADRLPISALYSSPSLTTVILPNTITSIGHHAFYNCTLLSSITLPESVEFIENSAFMQCSKLSSIELPASITSLEEDLFYSCSKLTSFDIPAMVTSIGERAFYSCSKLTSIDIPAMVTSIGERAFKNCSSLTSITIPRNITRIGAECFLNCTKLSTVNYNAINCTYMGEMAMYGSVFYLCPVNEINFGDDIINIPPNAFSNCSELTSVTLPSGVLSIRENTFYGCTGLLSVSIPSSVTSIESSAFSRSSLLESIYLYSISPIDLSLTEFIFSLTDMNTCVLHVPVGSKSAYQSAFLWQDFANIIEDLPVGVFNPKTSNIRIYAKNGQVIINGIKLGKTLTIYDLKGIIIYNKYVDTEIITVNLPIHGVYVVKVSEQNMKIIY